MDQELACPDCAARLTVHPDVVRCPEGHAFTPIGLALATNRNTVQALWAAIRSLEDDAAGLDYMAKQYPDARAGRRLVEAAEARDAAQRLRAHAKAAQQRLDALGEDLAATEPDG